jgi:hypothetical protein
MSFMTVNYQHLSTELILYVVNLVLGIAHLHSLSFEPYLILHVASSKRERGAKCKPGFPIELQVLEFSGLLTLLVINDAFLLLLLIEEH